MADAMPFLCTGCTVYRGAMDSKERVFSFDKS